MEEEWPPTQRRVGDNIFSSEAPSISIKRLACLAHTHAGRQEVHRMRHALFWMLSFFKMPPIPSLLCRFKHSWPPSRPIAWLPSWAVCQSTWLAGVILLGSPHGEHGNGVG